MTKEKTTIYDTDKLSYTRTILAQERTLMAWVRTSLALISFGFTIAKLFSDLTKMNVIPQSLNTTPKDLGIFLIIIGTSTLIIASVQHYLTMKALNLDDIRKRFPLSLCLAVLISLLGVFMLADIFFRMGASGV